MVRLLCGWPSGSFYKDKKLEIDLLVLGKGTETSLISGKRTLSSFKNLLIFKVLSEQEVKDLSS